MRATVDVSDKIFHFYAPDSIYRKAERAHFYEILYCKLNDFPGKNLLETLKPKCEKYKFSMTCSIRKIWPMKE